MYSVFIVDDESIVRDGLRNKINWDETEFNFAGEAPDGELALSMIQEIKPDILITDIKMPFMDGLELSKAVKKIQPWIRIIILSGHDEFEYAKKAISIGVDDYILKPFTSEEILNCLNKVSSSLNKQLQQFSDIERMKKQLESNNILIKDKFLSDVVLGVVNSSDMIDKSTELNINLLSRYYIICISEIHINDTDKLITAKTKLRDFIDQNEEQTGFFISPKRFVTIIKSQSDIGLEDSAYILADAIQHNVCKDNNGFVITAIGSIADRAAHISSSYAEAEKILRLCSRCEKNLIAGTSDIQRNEQEKLSLPSSDPLVDRLRYASKDETEELISYYMQLLHNNVELSSSEASYLLVDVIMSVSQLMEEFGGNIKEELPEILTHGYVEKSVKNNDSFTQAVRYILNYVFKFRDEHSQGRYSDIILKAKKYIDENFAQADTCLKSTADSVALSPNHFSAIFSQECGITFIEYLTSVRIEKAKKLLRTTNMRSSDIAFEVGFNDPHYFSYIFKKTTEKTPKEYRASFESEN